MRKKSTYAASILVLVCLICGAFFAPGIAMKAYDYRKTQSYEFQFRPGIDYEAVNTMYESDRTKRLMNYAEGIEEGRQYFIADTSVKPDSWEKLLNSIYNQNILLMFQDMGIMWMTEEMKDIRSIKDWNYYMIYDKDGAAFLCWYLEIYSDKEILRFLVDARDYTVYYVEIYQPEIQNYYQERLANMDSISDWFWQNILFFKDYYGSEMWYDDLWYDELKVKNQAVEGGILTKNYYGGSYSLSVDAREINSDIIFETGTLQLNASFLNRYGEYYGIGIGIEELIEFLPQEQVGEKLESMG